MTIAKVSMLALAIGAFAGTPVLAAQARLPREAERGRVFAQANCAPCHAIGPRGDSPYAPAPPFRTLHERYDVEGLAEALVEGIVVGHKGPQPMPKFVIGPSQADDLISYLKSLEPRAPR